MLRFSKMQGAGNDFVVIDGITQTFSPTSALIQALCDRHFGIGADQLLLLEKPTCYDVIASIEFSIVMAQKLKCVEMGLVV